MADLTDDTQQVARPTFEHMLFVFNSLDAILVCGDPEKRLDLTTALLDTHKVYLRETYDRAIEATREYMMRDGVLRRMLPPVPVTGKDLPFGNLDADRPIKIVDRDHVVPVEPAQPAGYIKIVGDKSTNLRAVPVDLPAHVLEAHARAWDPDH